MKNSQKLSQKCWTAAEIKNYRKWNAVESRKPESWKVGNVVLSKIQSCSSKLKSETPRKSEIRNEMQLMSWKTEMKISENRGNLKSETLRNEMLSKARNQKWYAAQSWKLKSKSLKTLKSQEIWNQKLTEMKSCRKLEIWNHKPSCMKCCRKLEIS